MNTADLKDLLRLEVDAAISDATLLKVINVARLKVAGDYDWQRLRYFDTLTTVANQGDYILPDNLISNPTSALVDKFIGMRGQADTDAPVELRNPDYFMQSIFSNEAEAMAIIEIGGANALSTLSKGQIKIRLKKIPTAAKTYDVLLKLPPAADSFDFVPEHNHLVFYWAALMIVYKKAMKPDDQGGFNNAFQAYQAELQSAIRNDFISPKEYGIMLPNQRWANFQVETATITSRR